jgi:protein-L-isoaspartate(D-aspartate) O-methyltransferase
MDIEQARFNMVEQQVRPWEVLDPKVLDLLFKVRREDYVPPVYRSLAFVDMEIPLGHDEAMWAPKIEARALQALQVKPHERVLEVGTGSGYFTALLASQAGVVVTRGVARRSQGPGRAEIPRPWPDQYPDPAGRCRPGLDRDDGAFDVIVLTGSTPLLAGSLPQASEPRWDACSPWWARASSCPRAW